MKELRELLAKVLERMDKAVRLGTRINKDIESEEWRRWDKRKRNQAEAFQPVAYRMGRLRREFNKILRSEKDVAEGERLLHKLINK